MTCFFPFQKVGRYFSAADAAKIRTPLSYRFFSVLSTDKNDENGRKNSENTRKTEKKV